MNKQAHNNQIKNYRLHTATLEGKRYTIAPVVMLMEGVHCGSAGPILYLEEDLAKFPMAWNGRPVPVQHPGGSANDPETLERQNVGWLFNVQYDSNRKALVGEVWIDPEKANEISPEVMRTLNQGEPLEVSTSMFFDLEEASGEWEGEIYEGIAHNLVPDHLALLPGGTGACSVQDGCGVRNEQEGGKNVKTDNIRTTARSPSYSGTETTSWANVGKTLDGFINGYYRHSGAARPSEPVTTVSGMPSAMKTWIASKSLLGDAGATTFNDLVFFPVVNPSTNKLNEGALRAVIGGRGSQANIPAAAKASAQRKAYSLLNSKFDAGLEIPEGLEEKKGPLEVIKKLGKSLLDLVRSEEAIENELAHGDIRYKLQKYVDAMDNQVAVHYIEEVFDNYFVYRMEPRLVEGGTTTAPTETKLYKRSYAVMDDEVTVGDEAIEVKKQISYVPVPAQQEGVTNSEGGEERMSDKKCCPEKVQMLIDNSVFTEDEREWLEALEEDKIDKLIAMNADAAAEEGDDNGAEGDGEPAVKNEGNEGVEQEQEVKLPEEAQKAIDFIVNQYKAEKGQLVSAIMSCENNTFTKEQLEMKDIPELRQIAQLVKPAGNYALKTGAQPPKGGDPAMNEDIEDPLIAPSQLGKLEKKTEKEAA